MCLCLERVLILQSSVISTIIKYHDIYNVFLYFQTFCVVSRRFQKHYVQRFSATRSLFIFAPWNKFRCLNVFLSTNQYFDYVVMLTILVNCIFLAMPENIEEAE